MYGKSIPVPNVVGPEHNRYISYKMTHLTELTAHYFKPAAQPYPVALLIAELAYDNTP
jgi:hypothetical protein